MATIELPTLGHFKNRNGWLGSAGLLRYQIETPRERADVEQPDDPENKLLEADVVLWQGPFSRPYAQEYGQKTFQMTQEGLSALTEYLTQEAEKTATAPRYTPEETTAFYLAKKQEEAAQ